MSGSRKLLMLAIADHARYPDGAAWPSVPTLAAMVGCSTRYVKKMLAELVTAGELNIYDRPGRSSLYVIPPLQGAPERVVMSRGKPQRRRRDTPPELTQLQTQGDVPTMPDIDDEGGGDDE